jgi:branched-chain amino acid transport system permease protein
LISRNIWHSRAGRALRAVGIDEHAAESVGLNAASLKLRVFVLGSVMAGIAGVLSAYYLRFVAPNSWDVGLTINLVTYLVVGGLLSPYGGAVGAAIIGSVLYYVSQHVGASAEGGGSSWDVVLSGVLLIFFLLVFRNGLASLPQAVLDRIAARRRPDSVAADETAEPDAALALTTPVARVAPADPLKSDTPVVVVEGLTKRFGGFTAVDDLSFSLRPGNVTALIGPNGAGKSTVINMLSGSLLPSDGAVGIMGRPLAGLEPRQVARLGLARTFQTPRLFEGMTLLETVMLARDPHGTRFWLIDGALRTPWGRRYENRSREEALAWLSYVGLADDAHVPATSLPVGKQRMAEVARALATEPSVLLLDEPAAGLDGSETRVLAQEIRALGDTGMAILLVEHDMPLVMAIADQVIVLEEGRKIAEGRPDEVSSDQAVIDAYLGVSVS